MRFLPRNNKIYLGEDGVTEIEGTGYHDERKWWITFIDPFDIGGMFKGRNMHREFWEQGGVESVGQGVNRQVESKTEGKEGHGKDAVWLWELFFPVGSTFIFLNMVNVNDRREEEEFLDSYRTYANVICVASKNTLK